MEDDRGSSLLGVGVLGSFLVVVIGVGVAILRELMLGDLQS